MNDLFSAPASEVVPAPEPAPMIHEGLWRGLPREFGRPDQVAERLAALPTLDARLALMARIPVQYHGLVQHFAEAAIAQRLVDIPTRAERLEAFGQVPEEWRDMVHRHTLRLWAVKKMRAAEADEGQREAA